MQNEKEEEMKETETYFEFGLKPSECQLDSGLTRTYLGDYFTAHTVSEGYLFFCVLPPVPTLWEIIKKGGIDSRVGLGEPFQKQSNHC